MNNLLKKEDSMLTAVELTQLMSTLQIMSVKTARKPQFCKEAKMSIAAFEMRNFSQTYQQCISYKLGIMQGFFPILYKLDSS